MSTRDRNPSETRSIQLEVEVPGTPEQVWEAIATGCGIAAWFVPAEVAEREGGDVSFDMGSGMEFAGKVSAWDRPRRFAYEEEWQPFEELAPVRLATEWIVEARSGDTCVVRLVSSVFTDDKADWDAELDNMREGWRVHLHILQLYLANFLGEPCSTIMVTGAAPGPLNRGWAALTDALGVSGATEGERAQTTAPGAPPLAGAVERVTESEHSRGLMLSIDEPGPGVAIVFVYSYRGELYTNFHAYLFGDEAPTVAARDRPAWQAWMQEHFPAVRPASQIGATPG